MKTQNLIRTRDRLWNEAKRTSLQRFRVARASGPGPELAAAVARENKAWSDAEVAARVAMKARMQEVGL